MAYVRKIPVFQVSWIQNIPENHKSLFGFGNFWKIPHRGLSEEAGSRKGKGYTGYKATALSQTQTRINIKEKQDKPLEHFH